MSFSSSHTNLFQVDSGLFDGCKNPGTFNNVLSPSAGPIDVGRVFLVEDGDLVSVDVEEGAVMLDLTC